DSAEIMADIESRIAEIFLSKLNEGKQVITLEDVNALVATMGSVRDFKAAEADNNESEETSESTTDDEGDNTSFKEGTKYTYHPPKQLVRDQKRKILGGVCAGLGYYLNVDPVWIRLLFALFTATYGIGLLVYVVMWIAMPGSYDIEEPAAAKKMFRDPEHKVLAGVSGGIAAYFGVDILVVRILFIAATFAGGIGLLVYIIMWIILPEARTITDRMQMQGEPVTLSGIESNIKKGLDVKEDESPLVKILLIPFRVIAFLINALAKILGPLTEVLRVIIGIFITIFGFGLIFFVIILIGLAMGIFTFPWPWLLDQNDIAFPLETIRNLIPGWMVFAGCVAALIPSIAMILLGLSVMSKRALISAPVGWTLFVLFFASVGALSFGIPQIAYSFKEVGEYKVEKVFPIDDKEIIVFRINEVGMDDYDAVALSLRGYDGKDLKLAMGYEAHGSTRQSAIENAQMVEYNVEQQDSMIIFDSNIRFKSDAIFRGQRLKLVLYIPYDHPFVLDEASSHFITQYIDWEYQDGFTWKMTQKGLECVNCPEKKEEETSTDLLNNKGDLHDFDEIELSGVFNATIRGGNEYAVEFTGPQDEKNKYNVYRSGETLVIDFEGKKEFDFKLKEIDVEEVRINITMPRLERLEASGYGSIRLEGLSHTNDLEIEANGPVKVRGELFADNLNVNLNGSSEADLSGKVNSLNADVKFASSLKAYNLEAREAIVEVNGASSAKVNVTESLEMEEGVASDIDYRGNPKVIKRD
ncbi:MAG TPA: PspC domain-containing protein, partial [Cyclobacteriaceae bacterium]|nr:PspC domain-containing protein [Cyclobacteriaceae bacterium]